MICNNVEKIRKVKGVTKTHLAGILGLSLNGYRYIMSKDSNLDVERVKLIADELNIAVEYFFDDKLTESVINEANRKIG